MKKTILIVIAMLASGFILFSNWTSGASKQVQKAWELDLPKGATEVYDFRGETGSAYYAFIYDTPEEAEEALEWQSEEGATIDAGTYTEAIETWIDEANVPDTLPIDIPEEGPFYYKKKADGSELIIVLDYRMLHMVEHVTE